MNTSRYRLVFYCLNDFLSSAIGGIATSSLIVRDNRSNKSSSVLAFNRTNRSFVCWLNLVTARSKVTCSSVIPKRCSAAIFSSRVAFECFETTNKSVSCVIFDPFKFVIISMRLFSQNIWKEDKIHVYSCLCKPCPNGVD